ncbi:MAG: peptidylprolyl isomerase [Hymenobacteraceae bacterium]|nr:peptidylprolyl isomerase [Hymenobacteraceae bacterium]
MILLRLAAATVLATSLASCAVMKKQPTDDLVTITTPQGEIRLLLSDTAPKHKANFLKLAREGFYDGTTFHRVINGFMIQGGDPNSKNDNPTDDGQGGPGYTVPSEMSNGLKHERGAIAGARLGDGQNPKRESSGSQFYLVQPVGGTPFLDGQYTVFGQTVSGFDVIDKISQVAKGAGDRPKTPVTMKVKVESLPRKKITELTGYQYPGTAAKK